MREYKLSKLPINRGSLWMNNEFVQFIFENASDSVLIIDGSDFTILECNKKAVDLFHASDKVDLINIPLFNLYQNEPAKFSKSMVISKIHSGETYTQELSFITLKNHTFWGRLSAVEIVVDSQNIIVLKITKVVDYLKAEEALSTLIRQTSKVTGMVFFKELTRLLSQTYDTKFAFIGKIDQKNSQVVTLKFCADQKDEKNIVFQIDGSPLQNIIKGYTSFYPQKLSELFPQNYLVSNMGIESFMGSPVFNSNGEVIGILAIMDDKPMVEIPNTRHIFSLFSSRIGAEIERMDTENLLRKFIPDFKSAEITG
ncbi:MAG: PAS domain-containing protein [Bacteroidales bacterium]|nr:PAS domain-containing protein [Bacteroidales bacterium]